MGDLPRLAASTCLHLLVHKHACAEIFDINVLQGNTDWPSNTDISVCATTPHTNLQWTTTQTTTLKGRCYNKTMSGSHTHPAFMPKGMPDAALLSTVLPADSTCWAKQPGYQGPVAALLSQSLSWLVLTG